MVQYSSISLSACLITKLDPNGLHVRDVAVYNIAISIIAYLSDVHVSFKKVITSGYVGQSSS